LAEKIIIDNLLKQLTFSGIFINSIAMEDNPDCQLQVLYDGGERLRLIDRLRNLFLRLSSAVNRRVGYLKQEKKSREMKYAATARATHKRRFHDSDVEREKIRGRRQSFSSGEAVLIRPYHEIQATLDADGCCEGLWFMPGMKKHCGRQAKILKRVRTIFDERNWKMVRIRNAYLLEGLICDGRDVFDGEGCDRSCYYFWKDKWLQRI